ncbi:MAG: lytic transglycosylase [Pelagibacterium sp. SCN 64-44]|nr:MAG: lytic transglycosylase [Pelagibacterium sp. SCN 64-44]
MRALIILFMSLVLSGQVFASQNPAAFLAQLWDEAKSSGIDRSVFESALGGYRPLDRIATQSANQPELVEGVGVYVAKRVDPRIDQGIRRMREWSDTLARIERQYGVAEEVLVSIWGMETNFGGYMGNEKVPHALATLSETGRRADYFRSELLTALRIIQDGHITADGMVGSWAGAMGQTQFMPSSFMQFAVDFDGDGRKNIWSSVPDALASAANYLRNNGWRPGETWGYEVRLPEGFSARDGAMTLAEWQQLGVRRVAGRSFPRPGDQARLYLPAGIDGPAFLTLPNFEVIKRYNNSNSYALSVGHLADRLIGGGAFVASWPNGPELTRTERRELQSHLVRLGYDVGGVDGVVGSATRTAISAFQRQQGLPVDGYPTPDLLRRLKEQV